MCVCVCVYARVSNPKKHANKYTHTHQKRHLRQKKTKNNDEDIARARALTARRRVFFPVPPSDFAGVRLNVDDGACAMLWQEGTHSLFTCVHVCFLYYINRR